MTRLAQILQQELSLVDEFLTLLNREQIALRDIQPESLGDVVAAKHRLVDRMNQLAAERARLSIGDLTPQAMTTWLTKQVGEKEASVLWPKLIERAREAKRMHELNGQLITIHLNRTTDALRVLGQQQSSHTLYGSDGQAFSGSGSRIIDAA